MATPEDNVETSAPPPPEPVEAVAAAVDEVAKEVKKEEEGKGKKGEGDLKSTLLISGAVVAVIGAIFAILKKVKEAASNADPN